MKKIYIDVETTGTNVKRHSIHQLSGIVEINGKVVDTFNYKVRPHEKAKIEAEALKVGGVTEEQILQYTHRTEIHKLLTSLLKGYINKYDPSDKAHIVGYNNRGFDDLFLRAFFKQCKDPYFGSWFWSDTHDVLVMASLYLQDVRASMLNFKLATVARQFGFKVDETRLHDAFYDVELTRKIYLSIIHDI